LHQIKQSKQNIVFMITSVCVFCGASSGGNPIYIQTAKAVGKLLASQNITLVFGGGKIGMMGAVADAVLEQGGKVIGVIPQFLKTKEVAHLDVSELIVVDSMHERKTIMHQLSDAVMVLPGGYGTLDELFEMLTWGQLGLHQKPIGLLNVEGYFDGLIQFVNQMTNERFLKPSYRNMLLHHTNAPDLLQVMSNYKAPTFDKIIDTAAT
jgi:uncharacterized protein (TIGR00730 family)